MNKKKLLLVLAFTSFTFLSGAFLINDFASTETYAQESSIKWEHCYIEPFGGIQKDVASYKTWVDINYFNSEGISIERITATTSDVARSDNMEGYNLSNRALSKAIFKLGNEGWEMIGEGKSVIADRNLIYFKRQKK